MRKLQRPPLHPSPEDKSIPKQKNKNKSPPATKDLNVSGGTTSEDSFADKSSPSPNRKRLYPDLEELGEISDNSESPMSNRDISTISNEEANIPEDLGTEKSQKETNRFWHIIIAVLGVIVLGLLFGLKGEQPKGPSNAAIVVKKLREDFANQPKLSLRSIKKSLAKVINSDVKPESPAVILFLSSKGAMETTDRFTDCLARLVELQNGVIAAVDAHNFHNMNPEIVKKRIDDLIEESVSLDHVNIFLIKHIDTIPGKAALIMQKYCDHENSPYKRAVVIMTISTQKEITDDADIRTLDHIARSHLNQTWADLNADQFDPLFTRISDYVSAILPEPQLPNCIF